jgi:hypothetical protein
MEDVLEVYHRPHDPDRPVVCVDWTSKQLIAETRVPIRPNQASQNVTNMSMSVTAPPTCS